MRKSLCLLVVTMLLTWMTTSANALSIRLSDDGASTYFDAGNTAFAQTSMLTDALHAGPAFSDVRALPSTYSLTLAMEVTHTAWSVTSFDASLNPVPEPGTLLLLGSGLLGVGMYGRRRNQS